MYDEKDELVGFLAYKRINEETVEIGLGLRPDLTGKGIGLAFVRAGVAFAQTRFSVKRVSLRVATFNQRAIRVYERAGFVRGGIFMQWTNGGEYEFLHMIRQTP